MRSSLFITLGLFSACFVGCWPKSSESTTQAAKKIPIYFSENRASLFFWSNYFGADYTQNAAPAAALIRPADPLFQNQVLLQLQKAIQYMDSELASVAGPRAVYLRSVEIQRISTETGCDTISAAVNLQLQKGKRLTQTTTGTKTSESSGETHTSAVKTEEEQKLEKARLTLSGPIAQTASCLPPTGEATSTETEGKSLEELNKYIAQASASGKIFYKYTTTRYMISFVFEDLMSPDYQAPRKVATEANSDELNKALAAERNEIGGISTFQAKAALPEEYGGGKYIYNLPAMDVFDSVELKWTASASVASVISLPEPIRSLAISRLGKIVPDAFGASASVSGEKSVITEFKIPLELEVDPAAPNALNVYQSKVISSVLQPLCVKAAQNRNLDSSKACTVNKPIQIPDMVLALKNVNDTVMPLTGCRPIGTTQGGLMGLGIGAKPAYKVFFWMHDLNRSVQKGQKVYFYEQSEAWNKNDTEAWIAINQFGGKSVYEIDRPVIKRDWKSAQPYMVVDSIAEVAEECLPSRQAKILGGRCARGSFAANTVLLGAPTSLFGYGVGGAKTTFAHMCSKIENGLFSSWGVSPQQKTEILTSNSVDEQTVSRKREVFNKPVVNAAVTMKPPADVVPSLAAMRKGIGTNKPFKPLAQAR